MGNRIGFINKSFFYFNLTLFILWIILFEFLLPDNNVLPRPGIVLLSIPDLFKYYNFLNNFFTSISAIYLPGILAFLFIFSIREHILGKTGIIKSCLNFISGLTIIVPALMTAFIIIYWFPHSFYSEYVFSFLVTTGWLLNELHSSGKMMNENYLLAFKSLGGEKAFLNKHIFWNELKPGIFKKLYSYHLQLWTLILIFEFIKDGYGLGTIFRKTLYYHDFSALIIMIIFISLIIFCGLACLRFIENKFVFWEEE